MGTNDALLAVTFTAALVTCLLKGKQWPTFITAAIFGCFFGDTAFGGKITGVVKELVQALLSIAHMG